MRRRFALLAVLAALLLTTACSPVRPSASASARAVAEGGTGDLNLRLPGKASSFNPFAPVGSTEQLLAAAQFQPLVVAPLGHIDPRAAGSWEFDSTFTRLKVNLALSSWSDGTKISADDVIFTLQQNLRPSNRSPVAPQLVHLKGAREFAAGSTDKLAGAVESGPAQVTLELTEPDPGFLDRLTGMFLLPAHVYRDKDLSAPDAFAQPGVGAGAYLFKQWESDGVTLLPNPRRTPTRLASVRVHFGSGPEAPTDPAALQVVLGTSPQALDRLPDGLLARSTPGKRILALRGLHGQLSDVRVRQGMMFALDRDALLHQLDAGRGRVTDSLMFTPEWAAESQPRRYANDPQKTRELLAAGGWNADQRLRIVVLSDTRLDWQPLQQQLARAGVQAEVSTRSVSERAAVLADASVGAVIEDLAMPTGEPTLVAPWVSCDTAGDAQGPNPGGYCDRALTEQLAQASRQTDPWQRQSEFRAVWSRLVDEVPALPLWVGDDIVVTPKRVDGVNPSVLPITTMMDLWGR